MNMMPTPIRRLLDSEEWQASSVMSAAAYLEYAGKSPGPDATPDEIQKYKESLQGWAFWLNVGRAAFGAFTPASPTWEVENPETTGAWQEWGAKHVDSEFWDLVSSTGDYGAAMAAWMRVHPDKVPFTVSKNETPSGAIVDANKAVGQFVTDNSTFFEKYPDAAPFWLTMQGENDWETWDMLKATGIKVSKTFEDFYSDLKTSKTISAYYDARDAHEAYQTQQAAAGAPSSTLDAEQQNYDAWRTMFLQQNPLVNDYLSAGGVRAQERENTIQQMEKSLLDPTVPKTESTNAINTLLQSYRAHEAWRAQQTGTDQATLDAKAAEQQQYTQYMTELSSSDPSAEMVWNMLLRYQG
jgi:hypothetical protein